MTNLVYVPLDSRPCNCKWPLQLARMIGQDLALPPSGLMDYYKKPADPDKIIEWLENNISDGSIVIASLDMLVYGGLVASRDISIASADINSRVEKIIKLVKSKKLSKFYLYSTILHSPQTPSPVLRQRNFEANKKLLCLADEKNVMMLVFGKDDVGRDDADIAAEHKQLQKINTLVMCGADELGICFLARALLDASGMRPAVYSLFFDSSGIDKISRYEDETVLKVMEKHFYLLNIDWANNSEKTDLLFFVNNFFSRQEDVFLDRPDFLNGFSSPDFSARIAQSFEEDIPAVLADIAYVNGADIHHTEELTRQIDWKALFGYSGWNTSANTIGAALSCAVIAWLGEKQASLNKGLKDKYILERLIEDWFYQSIVRQEIADELTEKNISLVDLGDFKPCLEMICKQKMDQMTSKLGLSPQDYKVSFPWPRIFEADVNLVI